MAQTLMTADLRRRAVCAMTALAAGDALGWPMEDRSGRVGGTASLKPTWELAEWSRREGGPWNAHVQPMLPGAISDDTQLALAVARSLLRGQGWWVHFTQLELPVWNVYQRGGGGATKRAAKAWLSRHEPWAVKGEKDRSRYFDAGGNGTAMRCLPHAFVDEPYDAAANRLDLDSIATHGHPYALLGSRLYGWATHWALRRTGTLGYGELLGRLAESSGTWARLPDLPTEWMAAADAHHDGYDHAWGSAVDQILHLLRIAADGLDGGALADDRDVLKRLGALGEQRGAGHITAVASIYLATRFLTQPKQGLLTAAFSRGGDTDTLAAMTGGLLGLLTNDGWLRPLDRHVQDPGSLTRAASRLIDGDSELSTKRFSATDRTTLYRFLDSSDVGSATVLAPFGRAAVADIADLKSPSSFVRVWTLSTEEDQTLLIKRMDKGKDGVPRWGILADAPSDDPGRTPHGSPAGNAVVPEQPRGGLVLLVSDLERARDFYETVAGMPVTRALPTIISFGGWLATELDERPQQLLDLTPANRAAIRLYLTAEGVERVRAGARVRGLPAASEERAGKRVLCVMDPDGYPVEFHTRNGVTPPVHSQ